MGFDANLAITLWFHNGRPYFYTRDFKMEFDTAKLPTIPEEFQKFESLRGWHWSFLLDCDDSYIHTNGCTQISVNDIQLDLEKIKELDEEQLITEELFHEFLAFCTWVKGTGLNFVYNCS